MVEVFRCSNSRRSSRQIGSSGFLSVPQMEFHLAGHTNVTVDIKLIFCACKHLCRIYTLESRELNA